MKSTFTFLAVATLFTGVFAQQFPVETGSPAAEADTGFSSTCCSDISTCSEDDIPCPHINHNHHEYEHSHPRLAQNVAIYPTPVLVRGPERCSCRNPEPECIETCREQHCSTCYRVIEEEEFVEPCHFPRECERKHDVCPPYCQLYTTTATFDYPYTTLSATETCTMTLLSCEAPEYNEYEHPYTRYDDRCEYHYPCHTPYAYGFERGHEHGHQHGQPRVVKVTPTTVPVVKYEQKKQHQYPKVVTVEAVAAPAQA